MINLEFFSYISFELVTTAPPSPVVSILLPQKLKIDGSRVFVNDFTGGKILIFGLAQDTPDIKYTSIVNPIPQAFTGDFASASENNLWYTTWVPETTGLLVKFNFNDYQNEISIDDTDVTLEKYIDFKGIFNSISMDVEGDVFGKIYEYFLGKFAMSEGRGGGEFFTPTSIVKLIVNIQYEFI